MIQRSGFVLLSGPPGAPATTGRAGRKLSVAFVQAEPRTASEREPACDGASLPVMDGDTVEMDGDTVERVVSMRELARRIAEQ